MTKKKSSMVGIALILTSSISVCFGQMLWKLGALDSRLVILGGGFALYGMGAMLMMLSFRYGKLSVLHPMMSLGYVLSLFVGAYMFREEITLPKVFGVVFVLVGLIFLANSDNTKEQQK